MKHQKYKHRVFYYMKRATKKLTRDAAMTKVIKEAKEEQRIQHMLSGEESTEIVATSRGVELSSMYSARVRSQM
jgi:hypothetical protein